MLTFYHAPQSRAAIVHWMLLETGAPFDYHLLDLNKNEQKAPAYLAVNPMGKVPAINHDGVVVTEAAAICAYLADAFPKAGLAPAVSDKRRGPYLRWLFFGPSCFEPAIIDATTKREGASDRMLGYGSMGAVLDVIAAAVAKGPYLLGEQFTAADVVIGAGLRWGTMTKAVPERPEFKRYAATLAERPALKRAEAKDAEIMAARAK
jgi:glutathione S-transferase